MPRPPANTRQAILDAGYRLFFRRGFARVGMEDIAAEAGVTKRTLYHHFGSKDALVGAVLEDQSAQMLAVFARWADPGAATPAAFLEGLFDRLGAWMATPGWTGPGFTRLAMELADLPGHPARRAARRHKAALQDWLAGELAGRGASDPAGLAAAAQVLIEGASALTLTAGGTAPLAAARGACRVLAGIGAPPFPPGDGSRRLPAMRDPQTLPYRPCVGVMLMDGEGRLFVGERGDTPGAWQMPQGGIDDGESVEEAALRELWEETGVEADRVAVVAVAPDWLRYDLPDELIGKVWGGRYRGQKQRWVLMRFLGTDADVRIDGAHPEFSDWRWLPPGDVLAQIVPFKRAVYAEALAAFAGQIGATSG